MSQLPYAGVRIAETSATLAGRLAGLLFADQGAQVRCSNASTRAGQEIDACLDRGKQRVAPSSLADDSQVGHGVSFVTTRHELGPSTRRCGTIPPTPRASPR